MADTPGIDLFIFAGEKSGDTLGADFLEGYLAQNPQAKIAGVGGPKMRGFPLMEILPMEAFEIMGFIDVAHHLPRLIRQFHFVKKRILELQPETLLLIDYPGFNLALAKKLRKKGFKRRIVQYVCPSVWAWKKGRIQTMSDTLDLLLTLLPFEPACFEGTSLPTHFVGHPLVKAIQPPTRKGERLALFPGSRVKEIERNLPLQLEAALESGFPLGISLAGEKVRPAIMRCLEKYPDIKLFDHPYDLMKEAAFAIATSGTINLELALHEIPTVVTFGISPLDLFIARRIFRIHLDHYSLVNIILKKRLFPELFGPHLTLDNLRDALDHVQKEKKAIISGCRLIRESLSSPEPAISFISR